MNRERIYYLLEQYISKSSTREELTELAKLVKDPQYKGKIEAFMDERYVSMLTEKEVDVDWDDLYTRVITAKPKIPVYQLNAVERKRNWRWIAAASIIVMLGVGGYLLFFNKSKVEGPQVTVAKNNDVPAPKETRAVITLADGTKVYLDSVNNGTIAQESDVNIVKTEDGRIIYSHEGAKAQSEIVYNTLTNLRGSKVIDMTLSDGSRVWLNAGSSVKYPVAFVGSERKVEITGEAYFEVAHNANKPFHVVKGETNVTVLGTHFNVNAYDDEEELRVTLLEGSVKVSSPGQAKTIKPGEQAAITRNAQLVTRNNIDVDEVMAWKNGLFQFNNADIETVMRQVARWYDVDVIYESKPTKIFRGGLPRDLSAMKVFKVLEETGGVHFRIEGRKIIVMK